MYAQAIESVFISAREATLGGMCLGMSNLGGWELTHGGRGEGTADYRACVQQKAESPENQRVRAGEGVSREEFGCKAPPRAYIHNPQGLMFTPILPAADCLTDDPSLSADVEAGL